MGEKIEVSYDDLQRIATSFNNGSQSVDGMIQSIQQAVDNLRATWEGRGADAFFKEMEEMIFPGLKKLSSALDQAAATSTQVSGLFQQAESEASGLFGKD